ncbi:MAG TPA: hypothetical protein VFC53_05425 [Dehalococcoidia bacterium]|nr:hypothetical protein [Dehalococcoidia bacterium]
MRGPLLARGLIAAAVLRAASYLGWLPATGVLPPPTQHPWRRNALMIFAHAVWGLATAVVTERMAGRR